MISSTILRHKSSLDSAKLNGVTREQRWTTLALRKDVGVPCGNAQRSNKRFATKTAMCFTTTCGYELLRITPLQKIGVTVATLSPLRVRTTQRTTSLLAWNHRSIQRMTLSTDSV